MEWREHVISDNKVLLGKPTVKGTRISVEHIIGLIAQGWTEQQILENYPRLTLSGNTFLLFLGYESLTFKTQVQATAYDSFTRLAKY